MKTILIVDDEESFAKTLALALEQEGYQATAKFSGEDALAFCEKTTPDLILSDLVMGGEVDGFTLMERLSKIPFVLITASGEKETLAKAKLLGAKASLAKPVDLDALLDLVRELVPK